MFIAYPDARLAHRHLVSVTRVARDASWADIQVRYWAGMWPKRQPLVDGAFAFPHKPYTPGEFSFAAQEADWHSALLERRFVEVDDYAYPDEPEGDES